MQGNAQPSLLRLLQQGNYEAWVEELKQAGPRGLASNQYGPCTIHQHLLHFYSIFQFQRQHFKMGLVFVFGAFVRRDFLRRCFAF